MLKKHHNKPEQYIILTILTSADSNTTDANMQKSTQANRNMGGKKHIKIYCYTLGLSYLNKLDTWRCVMVKLWPL